MIKKNILFILFILSGTFHSCDIARPIKVNDLKIHSEVSECGNISIQCKRIINTYILKQKFDGEYIVNKDSLKVQFNPTTIKMINMEFVVDGKAMEDEIFYINNKTISLYFDLTFDSPVRLDTAKMYILPSEYIICNNQPLFTDTLKFHLIK